MANKKTVTPSELPKPTLTMPRVSVMEKLEKRYEIGRGFEDIPISSQTELDKARDDLKVWHDYNHELLGTVFSNVKIAQEYRNSSHGALFIAGTRSFYEMVDDFRESVRYKQKALRSIMERLDLFDEPTRLNATLAPIRTPVEGSEKDVFIVHGHDEALKEKTARLVSDLGLNPIILNEQPNKGGTIIEKLEANASRATFAIVLMTPDDEGYSVKAGPETASARARQNVVMELGYFIGKLGRSRTCTVYKDMEMPSDFSGTAYIPYDELTDAWRYAVAKELKAAGYSVDMNDL